MSHYKVKSMGIEDGVVYLTVASSRISPPNWYRSPIAGYEGMDTRRQLLEIGRGLFEGDFQFLKGANCKAKLVYEHCKQRHGTYFNHHDGDWKKHRERFAVEFSRRMCA